MNLREAKPFDPTGLLPDSGMLHLFLDLYNLPYDDPFWSHEYIQLENWTNRFTYFDGDLTSLRKAALPAFLTDESDEYGLLHFPACAVRFSRELSLEYGYDAGMDALDLTQAESIAYETVYGNEHHPADGTHVPHHQLFGNPFYVQGPTRPSNDWLLLLQIDWDPEIGLNMGDAGVVHLWIRGADLAARNFNRMRLDLDMS